MTTKTPPRPLTPAEIGACIRRFRQSRHWSQEQLAEISGQNVRTVQRVEQGTPASFDARRALARTVDFNDIDALNRPLLVPTDEELQTAQAQFECDYITPAVDPLTTERELASLIVSCEMDLSEPVFELPHEAASEFAALTDFYPEYRVRHDLYSEVDKLDIYDELKQHIEALPELGLAAWQSLREWVPSSEGTHADELRRKASPTPRRFSALPPRPLPRM